MLSGCDTKILSVYDSSIQSVHGYLTPAVLVTQNLTHAALVTRNLTQVDLVTQDLTVHVTMSDSVTRIQRVHEIQTLSFGDLSSGERMALTV